MGEKKVTLGWSFRGISHKQLASRIIFCSMILAASVITVICIWNAFQWIDRPFAGFLVNRRMAVLEITHIQWTGKQAGLKYPDKIIKADGSIIASRNDFYEVVSAAGAGKPVIYTVQRGDETFTVTVPTMLFTVNDLIPTFGLGLTVGIIYLLIGAIVFFIKPDTKVSWAFMFVCFFQGLSSIMNFDAATTTFFSLWIVFSMMTFIPSVVLYFSFHFPVKSQFVEKHSYIEIGPFVVSSLFLISAFLIYPRPQVSLVYIAVIFYIGISALALIVAILHAFRKGATALARQRAKVVFYGAVLAFPIPLIVFLADLLGFTLIRNEIFSNFRDFLVIIFPASIAYSIAKHNLFDVDVYIKRAVGYGIMTAVVGITYFVLQLVLREVILTPLLGDYADKIYPVLFAILIVFLFNPLNRRVQTSVDKLFYRTKIDYKDTVLAVSNALTSVFKLDEITGKIIRTLREEMFIDRAGVILLEHQKECTATFIGDSPNAEESSIGMQCLQPDDPLIELLTREKKLITKYDIDEDPYYGSVKESCGERFSEMGLSIVLPFQYQEKVIGLLALGNKKSGHFYTREDLELLETLSNQSAVAIENARLFEENLEKGRMEEELKIAHDLQVSMLPEKAPEVEGLKIAAHSIPAREVGGDFFDFIEIQGDGSPDRLGIVVADVSGKAVSGALVMAASRSVFRVLSETQASVKEMMSIGNIRLKHDIRKGMFVALLYAVLDPMKKTMTLSSAGQTQPILCSADTGPRYIDTEGDKFPLGIVKEAEYEETQITLSQGDTIVLYTDGVVEAVNSEKEMYGFDRFLSAIDSGKKLPADELLKNLMDDVAHFVGEMEQHDDITIVVVKVE